MDKPLPTPFAKPTSGSKSRVNVKGSAAKFLANAGPRAVGFFLILSISTGDNTPPINRLYIVLLLFSGLAYLIQFPTSLVIPLVKFSIGTLPDAASDIKACNPLGVNTPKAFKP